MPAEKQRLTFISYSRADKDFVLGLARELRSSGFLIWLDQLDIPAGARWDDEVEKALDQCEIFMVILTPRSISSNNVKDEIGYAIDSNKRIMPVLLENVVLPLRLRRFQYVDFTKKSHKEGIEAAKQLLRDLLNESDSPQVSPSPDKQRDETLVAVEHRPLVKKLQKTPGKSFWLPAVLVSVLFLVILLCGFAAIKFIPLVSGLPSTPRPRVVSPATTPLVTQSLTATAIPVAGSTTAPTISPTDSAPCGRLQDALPAPAGGALGSADNPIVITFVPSGDTGKITKAGTDIADCLSQMIGLSFRMEVGTTFAASIEAMGAEKAQVGFLNTFSVLLAKQKYQIVPALVAIRKYATNDIDPDKNLGGQLEPFYKGQFIASVSSGINSLADLRGRTFCFVDPNSTSGYIVPRIILKAHGIDPDADFAAIQNAGSHPNVAIAVYKGDCDAGVTFINVLTDASANLQVTYPDIADKVRVFAVTERIPNDGMQFIKSLDPKLQAVIVEGMLKMAGNPDGQATLKSLYNYDAFQKIDPTFYDDFSIVLRQAGVDPATLVK